jgi:hypothetical protein
VIGIIPSKNRTFEVDGTFESKNPVEGKLYVDPVDGRIYFYSTTLTRSNPDTGFFPVWNGSERFISKFSNERYLDRDVIRTDLERMSGSINREVAENVRYRLRRSDNEDILEPPIRDTDNMFTQIVKGIITQKRLTLVDLVDMSGMKKTLIENYYSSLNKISLMRRDRWELWISSIFKLTYYIIVYKNGTEILRYDYPSNKIDTGIVEYDASIGDTEDPLKRIVKTIMIRENISKATMRSDEVDDYTINNLLTTISSKKPLSAQLFSRFMRITALSFTVTVCENGNEIFKYREYP